MTIEILNSYRKLEHCDIVELEELLEVTLPEDYVNFLLEHNGGTCRYSANYALVDDIPGGCAGLRQFSAITDATVIPRHDLRATDNLPSNDREYDGIEPLIRIGDTEAGRVLLCCQRGPLFGRLYYKPYETFDDNISIYVLALSFRLFFESLSLDEDYFFSTDPVFRLIEAGDANRLKNILDSGLSVETRNEKGETLLFASCDLQSPRCLNELILQGGDINARSGDGLLPIHAAARSGSLDCCRILVDHGVDLNSRSEAGETPLIVALKSVYNNWMVDRFLIDSGASPEIRGPDGEPALGLVATNKSEEAADVLELLVSKGCDVEYAIKWVAEYIRSYFAARGGYYDGHFIGLRRLGGIDELIRFSDEGISQAMEQAVAIAPDREELHEALRKHLRSGNELTQALAAYYLGKTRWPSRDTLMR